MTLQQAFNNFIESRILADLSPKSIKAYQEFVKPFIALVGSQKPFSDVSQEDIKGYLLKVVNKPLSKATRATYIRHLKIFLKWAGEEYATLYDYKKIRVPKSPRREVRIYTADEVLLIFSSVHAECEWITLRNQAIVALMYDSGLRQAEVCGICRKNVIFAENRLTVRGKGDKERTVPFGEYTKSLMREYLVQCPFDSKSLFVNRYGDTLTCNAVKLMVSKLADILPFELSSHKLRHNFATNWCIDQFDRYGHIDIYQLKALMGHDNIETTERYLHFAYDIIASRNTASHIDLIKNGTHS